MALISAETEVPCCEAMRPRVSPDTTVCDPPEEVVELLDEELEPELLGVELADELEPEELEPPGMVSRSPG